MSTERDEMRCPICGEGVLADVAWQPPAAENPEEHNSESVEIYTFTCGHETRGGKLATSDYEVIDVEHRRSEEIAQVAAPTEDEEAS
jgi:hypothetical protein